MEGFRKMPKMGSCECAVPRMKTGGYVSRVVGHEDQGFKPMKKANGGIISMLDQKPSGKPALAVGVAPGKPSMAARREAMKAKPKAKPKLDILIAVGKGKKSGGEVKETAKHEAAEKKAVTSVKTELKSHEKLPASKAHKGLKCGGKADKVKRLAEGGSLPERFANRAAAQSPSQQSSFQQGMGITNQGGLLAFEDNAGPHVSSSRGTPQEEMVRRMLLRANPEAGNPQAFDPAGNPVYYGGSKAAQSLALQQAQAALPETSRYYAKPPPPIQVAPPINNGNGGFGPPNPVVGTPGVPGGGLGGASPGYGGGGGGNINTNPIGFLGQQGGGYNKYQPRQAVVQGNRLVQGPSGMKNGGRVR